MIPKTFESTNSICSVLSSKIEIAVRTEYSVSIISKCPLAVKSKSKRTKKNGDLMNLFISRDFFN